MSKRVTYTTITSLPEGITRATVLDTLHSHTEMIDLNPLVEERHPCKPPRTADAEESVHCTWYSMTDKINYLPGGLASGKVTYYCSFNDLSTGLQTHCYAPLGLDIRGKWSLGGSLPGEPRESVELGLGVPKNGLYLREDTDFRCNYFMTKFVKKNLVRAHATLVDRLIEKAHLSERIAYNTHLSMTQSAASTPCDSTYSNSSDHHQAAPSYTDSRSSYHDQAAPSYTDSRSSRSSSTTQSPGLPYQSLDKKHHSVDTKHYTEAAAPPYPYHGVDPAYKEANPYDSSNMWEHRSERLPHHSMELPTVQTPVNGSQNFQAVELPVHEVAPLRVQKTSPRTSSRMESAPVVNRLPGGRRPCQSQR